MAVARDAASASGSGLYGRVATAAPRPLWKIGWRYLTRHGWQTVLMVLGIALGVAVVVAVDLANVSARQAFDLSVDAVAGRATHRIVAGPQGLDEATYAALRRAGVVRAAAPIVTAYATSSALGDRPVQLLGVDPFAEAPFRSYFSARDAVSVEQLTSFLTTPGAVLIGASLADRYQLQPGSTLPLEIAGRRREVVVAGLLEPGDELSRRALEGIILADVSTAQEVTGRVGRLDRIDLIIPEPSESEVAEIEALVSRVADGTASAGVQPVETRTGATEQMTAAFRLNLTALSLLALVVGMFLIYNTMTFSVVQRRPLFGVLRSLGVTRREVFVLVLAEALVVGAVSAALGLGLGVLMGQSAIQMVTRTITDLYFVLTVRGVDIPIVSLVKGGLLGVGATMVAAAAPAREAATVPPRAALSRSGLESKAERAARWAAVAGVFLILLGVVTLTLPTRSLIVSFGGTFLVILGFALLTPLVTKTVMNLVRPCLRRTLGILGGMAPRDVSKSLSRTAIAVAALMVAMSVTIGISLMITSFRQTVVVRLNDALQGDVVVSAPGVSGLQDVTPVDAEASTIVADHPDVDRVDLLRSATVQSPLGPIDIEAGNSPDYGDGLRYRAFEGSAEETWEAVRDDDEGGRSAVIISEPLANRLGLSKSDTLSLYTDEGLRTFPIVGIYYDYASTQGTVIMSLSSYRRAWNDDTITALVVRLRPGADPNAVARDLEEALAPVQGVLARPNQAIREAALAIFDRTFAITGALQALATIVAFIGVLSALLALQLEKQRQFGILRAVGLTVPELRGLILLETGLMGTVAGLLSMPAGLALALILVFVINRRSFGWTLQMVIAAAPFAQAMVVSLVASLLAGIYPAIRMGKMAPAEALRYE